VHRAVKIDEGEVTTTMCIVEKSVFKPASRDHWDDSAKNSKRSLFPDPIHLLSFVQIDPVSGENVMTIGITKV